MKYTLLLGGNRMLKHDTLRNTEVATHLGKVTFDDKGESKDLSATNQKALGKLHGFNFVEEKEEKKASEQGKKEAEELKKEEDKSTTKAKTTRRKNNTKVDDQNEDPKLNPKDAKSKK